MKIILGNRDVRKTIHSILQTCNLPTSYLDSIPQNSPEHLKSQQATSSYPHQHQPTGNETNDYYWSNPDDVRDVENDIEEALNAQDSLR